MKPKVCAVLVRVSRLTLVVVGEEVVKSSRRFDFGVLVDDTLLLHLGSRFQQLGLVASVGSLLGPQLLVVSSFLDSAH